MGLIDSVTVKYLRNNKVFADAFNFFIYNGEQRVKPEDLRELDTRELDLLHYEVDSSFDGAKHNTKQNTKDKKGKAGKPAASKGMYDVERTRDVVKSFTAMTDSDTAYVVLAIEAQSHIHYAMPVRNMVYDALQYSEQVQKIASRHRAARKNNKGADTEYTDADEYLSGFTKEDILIPVVTLVIYFGSREWDGAMSIHEMFRNCDERLLSYVPDYRINLIAPASIDDADFARFSSNLREVLSFIKYSSDKQMIDRLLDEDENFNRLEREAVDVLNACVNAKIAVKEKEEVVDVCKAIQDMIDEAKEKAVEETVETTIAENIRRLIETTGWTIEQAMDSLMLPEKDRAAVVKLLEADCVHA